MKLEFNPVRTCAYNFAYSKGQLPHTLTELAEWLIEFSAITEDMLQRAIDNYQEHLSVCNQPFVIKDKL